MPATIRSLDHFAIAVDGVEAAGDAYERLGFQTLPRMRHIELGSSNRVVQLHDTYLELVGDLENTPPLLRDRMLPRFACGEGLAIVSLTSSDLRADRERVSASAWAPDRILNARRKITMPSGAEDETDSSCFYVWNPGRTYSTLFYSEHGKPETIWIPQYQRHPNTARRITSLIYAADDPRLEVEYCSLMLGAPPQRLEPDEVSFTTARGETIEYLSHARLAERFGPLAPGRCAAQPVLGVGLSFEVDDLDACAAVLQRHQRIVQRSAERIVVAPAQACGVMLEFHA